MAPYPSKAYRDAEFEFRGRGCVARPAAAALGIRAGCNQMVWPDGRPRVRRPLPVGRRSSPGRMDRDKVREVQIEAVKNSSWMSAEARPKQPCRLR